MKIAYLTQIKNEEELIYYNLLYHYNLGIRAFFVCFNNSNEETREEVNKFKKEKQDSILYLYEDKEYKFNQPEIFTKLANEAYNKGYSWNLPVDADELLIIKNENLYDLIYQWDHLDSGFFQLEWLMFHPTGINDNYFLKCEHRETTRFRNSIHNLILGNRLKNLPLVFGNKTYKTMSKWSPENNYSIGHHSVGNSKLLKRFNEEEMFIGHFPSRTKEQITNKIMHIGKVMIEAEINSKQIEIYKEAKEQEEIYFDNLWEAVTDYRTKYKDKFIYNPINENYFK